jgi:hypothetical protein
MLAPRNVVTNQLTEWANSMEQSVPWERNVCSESREIPELYETMKLITLFTKARC